MYKLSGVGVPLFHKMILIPYPDHFLSFVSLLWHICRKNSHRLKYDMLWDHS